MSDLTEKTVRDVENILSEILQQTRSDRNWTQEAVAEAIHKSPRWYQKIEKSGKIPGGLTLLRILILYNIDVQIFRDALNLQTPKASSKRKEKKQPPKTPG